MLRTGMSAQISKTLGASQVRDYAALAGAVPAPGVVPEPLIGAMFSCLLGMRLPGLGTNYLKQETNFVREVRVGETLTARVEITRLRPDKHLADLRTTCHDAAGAIVCDGRALVYVADVNTDGDHHAG